MRERIAWDLARYLSTAARTYLESSSGLTRGERKYVAGHFDQVIALAGLRLWALKDRRMSMKLWVLLNRLSSSDMSLLSLIDDLNIVTNFEEGE